MSFFDLFNGSGPRPNEAATIPPLIDDNIRTAPEFYISSDAIRHAVNTAIALGRPLLVTGEPGTGKTQLASRIAWELTPTFPKPLRFQVKSRSDGSELFYRYDSLRHFQDAQVSAAKSTDSYIRIEALGEAILRANPAQDNATTYRTTNPLPATPMRSVVLIDEIDKAPRDLPNDILAEIEEMKFTILETGHEFKAESSHFPVVLLTSNSERDLPDAFLRRCVYLHIERPQGDSLKRIIRARVKPTHPFSDTFLDNVITRFEQIRKEATRKPPATDELLSWVKVLDRLEIDPLNPRPDQKVALGFTYSILVKDKTDLAKLTNA